MEYSQNVPAHIERVDHSAAYNTLKGSVTSGAVMGIVYFANLGMTTLSAISGLAAIVLTAENHLQLIK